MKVVNYSELRANLKQCLDKVAEDAEELIITRKDQKDLVLISLEEYSALKETQYLLSSANGKRLRASVEAVKKGDFQQKGLLEE
ncbi:type II toxin-antitoxin system Phd/YefM family antitoxin [Cesiribacter sp. SM1]|uniref:type II toxin-antitoxin system Phd/YefM family antitoxin n=1 Tax=Cesiribacter sp. SM1 TaxID=2861196 RepID=UPI001CD2E4AC|nr:type II toxin-antitoxin system prevent-host-death family antitoxin [Cesiribacter sp. SM1]